VEEQAMNKAKRKWKRTVGRIKKLRIASRVMNLGMFIIGWFLVVGIAVLYVRGFGMKTIISNDSMEPTFQEDEILKINQFIYKISTPKRMEDSD
jgi:signal peptidase I